MCQTLFQHARKRQTLRWTIDLHQSPRGRCTRPTGAKNHGAAGTGGLRTICKWSMLVPLFNYIIIILPMKMLIWGFVVHVLCSRSQHITRHIFQRLFRCRGSWWLLEDWNLAWTRRWMLPHWWSLPGAKTPRPGRCRCRSPRCVPVTFWSSFFFSIWCSHEITVNFTGLIVWAISFANIHCLWQMRFRTRHLLVLKPFHHLSSDLLSGWPHWPNRVSRRICSFPVEFEDDLKWFAQKSGLVWS